MAALGGTPQKWNNGMKNGCTWFCSKSSFISWVQFVAESLREAIGLKRGRRWPDTWRQTDLYKGLCCAERNSQRQYKNRIKLVLGTGSGGRLSWNQKRYHIWKTVKYWIQPSLPLPQSSVHLLSMGAPHFNRCCHGNHTFTPTNGQTRTHKRI